MQNFKKPIRINNPVYVIPGSTRVRVKPNKYIGIIFTESLRNSKKYSCPAVGDVLLVKRVTRRFVYLSSNGVNEDYRIRRDTFFETYFEFDPLPKVGTYCYGLFHSVSRKTYPFLIDGVQLVYMGDGEDGHRILSWTHPVTNIPYFVHGVHDDRIRASLSDEDDHVEREMLPDGIKTYVSKIVKAEKELLKSYHSQSYFE